MTAAGVSVVLAGQVYFLVSILAIVVVSTVAILVSPAVSILPFRVHTDSAVDSFDISVCSD